jgi:hypothetical protein
MTLVQQLGVMGMPLVIGFLNDRFQASADNPVGHIPGMWAFSILGFLALFFAIMLRRKETGPNAHGLETITAGDPTRFKTALGKSLVVGLGFAAAVVGGFALFGAPGSAAGGLWFTLGIAAAFAFVAIINAVILESQKDEGSWILAILWFAATCIALAASSEIMTGLGKGLLTLVALIGGAVWP